MLDLKRLLSLPKLICKAFGFDFAFTNRKNCFLLLHEKAMLILALYLFSYHPDPRSVEKGADFAVATSSNRIHG